ncbi:MAG: hypothetical protein ACP5UL_03995 [Thermoplasmata archaeon]
MNNKSILAIVVIVVILLGAVVGYFYLVKSNSSTSSSSGSTGSLVVAVHDKKPDVIGTFSLYISFNVVMVHKANTAGNGWYNISVRTQVIDITSITSPNLQKGSIAFGNLSTGKYTAVWLGIKNASIQTPMGNINLTVPSNATYVKVVGNFNVNASSANVVDIDITSNPTYMEQSHMISVAGRIDSTYSMPMSASFASIGVHDAMPANVTGHIYIYIGINEIIFIPKNGTPIVEKNLAIVVNITKYKGIANSTVIWNGQIPSGAYKYMEIFLSNASVNASIQTPMGKMSMNGNISLTNTTIKVPLNSTSNSTLNIQGGMVSYIDIDMQFNMQDLVNRQLMITGSMDYQSTYNMGM